MLKCFPGLDFHGPSGLGSSTALGYGQHIGVSKRMSEDGVASNQVLE